MNLLFAEPEALPQPTFGEIVEALEAARQLVGAGWVQRRGYAMINGRRCYCLAAAITRASRTRQIREAAIAAIQLAVAHVRYGLSIEQFNDHKATNADDVKVVLYRAKSYVGQVIAA